MTGRQYIPLKLHFTKIKLYGIADEKGFIYSFWIYREKKNTIHNAKPHQILLDFANILNKTNKHIIYFDSYYDSSDLAKLLHDKEYNFVLSAKSNRPTWLFKDYLHKKLKKNEWNWRQNNNVIAVSFWNVKKCNFYSNCYSIKPIKKSFEIVAQYNKYKGALDQLDAH